MTRNVRVFGTVCHAHVAHPMTHEMIGIGVGFDPDCGCDPDPDADTCWR